ncbi:hypothetical protein EV363DRAFT_1176483, partial [Boletus edulis]
GAGYAWADTVCIDKSSSTELDELICSMSWYRNVSCVFSNQRVVSSSTTRTGNP